MRFAPSEFWEMTIKEANLVIDGDIKRQEHEFIISFYAQRNAIGVCLSDKYEFYNPFKKDKKEKVKPKSPEELKSNLDDMIKNWR